MPISSAVPKLIALVLTVAALGLGLTKYTSPIHGGPAYADLRHFLGRALGDHAPVLPGPPPALDLTPASALPAPIRNPELGDRIAPETAARDISQPQRWFARMAARDSAALRGWLGVAVLPTAVVHGDTVETTLLRLTLHRGCPILSRLTAISVGQASWRPRLVSVTANCPRLSDPPSVSDRP